MIGRRRKEVARTSSVLLLLVRYPHERQRTLDTADGSQSGHPPRHIGCRSRFARLPDVNIEPAVAINIQNLPQTMEPRKISLAPTRFVAVATDKIAPTLVLMWVNPCPRCGLSARRKLSDLFRFRIHTRPNRIPTEFNPQFT